MSEFIGHDSPLGDQLPVYVDDITGRETYEGTIGSEALRTITGLGITSRRAVFVLGSDRCDTAETLVRANHVSCARRI